jgi:hypothetical protein
MQKKQAITFPPVMQSCVQSFALSSATNLPPYQKPYYYFIFFYFYVFYIFGQELFILFLKFSIKTIIIFIMNMMITVK